MPNLCQIYGYRTAPVVPFEINDLLGGLLGRGGVFVSGGLCRRVKSASAGAVVFALSCVTLVKAGGIRPRRQW